MDTVKELKNIIRQIQRKEVQVEYFRVSISQDGGGQESIHIDGGFVKH